MFPHEVFSAQEGIVTIMDSSGVCISESTSQYFLLCNAMKVYGQPWHMMPAPSPAPQCNPSILRVHSTRLVSFPMQTTSDRRNLLVTCPKVDPVVAAIAPGKPRLLQATTAAGKSHRSSHTGRSLRKRFPLLASPPSRWRNRGASKGTGGSSLARERWGAGGGARALPVQTTPATSSSEQWWAASCLHSAR